MYEEVAKIIFDYTKKNKQADEEYVEKLVDVISNGKNIEKYISKIEIKEAEDSSYNINTGELQISLDEEYANFEYKLSRKNNFILNANVALTVFHELDHANYKKTAINDHNSLDSTYFAITNSKLEKPRIIELDDETYDNLTQEAQDELLHECEGKVLDMAKSVMYYILYHDKAPYEKRANINSNIDLDRVINKLYNTSIDNKVLEKYRLLKLKKFIKVCRYGYTTMGNITNSPAYDYFKKIGLGEMLLEILIYDSDPTIAYKKAKSLYTLQQRIIYGLPLTREELNGININSNPFHIYEKKK